MKTAAQTRGVVAVVRRLRVALFPLAVLGVLGVGIQTSAPSYAESISSSSQHQRQGHARRFAQDNATSEEIPPAPKLALNAASANELTALPGIGPSKAAKIVAFRDRYGPFKRIKDLRRVKGIGRKTLQRLKPYLTLNTSTVDQPRST